MQTNANETSENGPSGGNSTLSSVDRFLAYFEDFLDLIAGMFVFLLMATGIVQVVGRQLFNSPMSGYVDLVELSMATFVFLGAAYCQRLGGHVRMEMILMQFPKRLLWIAESFATILALFIVAILIIYGWDHTVRAYVIGDSTIDAEYPTWPSKLMVPLAFVFLWLRLFLQLFGYLRLVAAPDARPVAVPVIATVKEQAAAEIEDSMGQEIDEAGLDEVSGKT